jgi:DNA-binding NarL/FixJ family response regulator
MAVKVDLMSMDLFTPREQQVIILIVAGNSNKIIAKILGISNRTIAVHAHSIYRKLNLLNKNDKVRRGDNIRCTAIVTMIARGMVLVSELQSDKTPPTSHQHQRTRTLDI